MNIITDFTSVKNSSCLIRLMVTSVENIQLTNLMKLISSFCSKHNESHDLW